MKTLCLFSAAGEKRKPSEPPPQEDAKRQRVVGDVPQELINQVLATMADPATAPEVMSSGDDVTPSTAVPFITLQYLTLPHSTLHYLTVPHSRRVSFQIAYPHV